MKNIQDMNKDQLRRYVRRLWAEDDRLLEYYDCYRTLAEHIGPARIREIRLELEAIEIECSRRNATEAAGIPWEPPKSHMSERAIFLLMAIAIGLTGWYIFDILNRVSAGNPIGF